jgi:hypothetical protein
VVRQPDQRSDGHVLHSKLDALEVVRRHTELNRKLFLGPDLAGAQLSNATPDVLGDAFGIELSHGSNGPPPQTSKTLYYMVVFSGGAR